MFRAPAMLLPHESTVAHEQRFTMDAPMISRSRSRITLDAVPPVAASSSSTSTTTASSTTNGNRNTTSVTPSYNPTETANNSNTTILDNASDESRDGQYLNKGLPTVPHARPETPRTVTHNHDEDCSDEDSDGKEKAE